ncbi:MAG: hypothetical protein V1702_02295 [Candidatus Woesearchaeota archaeon]
MSKKGVELTVNFIVVLILAVVAMGYGIKVVVDLMDEVGELSGKISPSAETELNSLLEKERIASFPGSQPGFRAKQAQFAIGIMNTENKTSFFVNATLKGGFNGNAELNYDFSKFKFTYINATQIPKGTSQKFPVIVTVPKDAPSGTYIINFYACSGISTPLSCSAENAYDSVEKMYLVVK